MSVKDRTTKSLVDWHFKVDPKIKKVYRFLSQREDDPNEPIKLLEVSSATPASGSVVPFAFGPTSQMPYRSVIATVTPEEMLQIKQKHILLPVGWDLTRTQFLPNRRMKSRRRNGLR